jgi:hypothetical protein
LALSVYAVASTKTVTRTPHSLEFIYLATNSLSSAIPLGLVNAPLLSELNLAGNALPSMVPATI